MNDNISISFSPEDLETIQTGLQALHGALDGILIALTPDQRKSLPKMSDKTLPFVLKVAEYINSEPQYAPPYLNVDALKIDLRAATDLINIKNELDQLTSAVDDTAMLAGSEAYVAALAYYNSVKRAASTNVPGAKPIFDDLKSRFGNR